MTNTTTLANPPMPSFTAKPTPQTPTAGPDTPLFTSNLISPEVLAVLPDGYTIRPLRRSDFHRGYLDVLRVLTTVGDVTDEQWDQRYDWISARNDEYYLLVVCDDAERIVGTGSLIVERKFIHNLGLVGHIEDIAVEKGQQGKKLGLRIIQALDYVAANVGCYKVFSLRSSPFTYYFDGFRTMMMRWLTICRASSIAQRQMKGSTSSAGSSVLVSKWRITTEIFLREKRVYLSVWVHQAFSDRHSLSY